MRITSLAPIAAVVTTGLWTCELSAQGYYHGTAGRNHLTGRQQIVDYQKPRWTGGGQGGFMFDGPSGTLQVTAVGRNRFTGRLEYYNQFVNPWTGARYTTGTQFNPFTGRYQTLHQFVPPPPQQPEERDAELAEVQNTPLPKRGIRVIETPQAIDDPPAEVAPALESVEQTTAEPAVTLEIRKPE